MLNLIQLRKGRVNFSIKKDICLLQAALQFNPWQLGKQHWKDVAALMGRTFGQVFTPKSVEKRVDLLVNKFKTEELKVSTGTEEEKTERGRLLSDIIAIQ